MNQAALDEVESQVFTYDVKLTNVTGYNLLTWKEVIDQNSTKCNIFSLFACLYLIYNFNIPYFDLYIFMRPF